MLHLLAPGAPGTFPAPLHISLITHTHSLMATKGIQSTPSVSGTDGNDFAYRQTIDLRYQASADAKSTLEQMTLAFTSIALLVVTVTIMSTEPHLIPSIKVRSVTGMGSAVDFSFAGAFFLTGMLGSRAASGLHASWLTNLCSFATSSLLLLTVIAAVRVHGLVGEGSLSVPLLLVHGICVVNTIISFRASRALAAAKAGNRKQK